MNYTKFANWIIRKLISLERLTPVAIIYIIFIMTSRRKHTLAAAAKFANTSKARFNNLLKNHSDLAIFALSELSKKQARQFSKTMHALGQNSLPWNIAIIVDATFLGRSSLHTENAKKFNHGKGYVIGHQWTNIVLLINDKVIPLPPIAFYTTKYCRTYGIQYQTENERVIEYLVQLQLEQYIGAHAPQKVVFLADSGYDDHRIEKTVAGKKWSFIIALKSSRSVKTESVYNKTKKSEGWKSIAVGFKRNRRVKWQPIRVPKNSGKKKRMEFRIRQVIGYLRNFGKAQLICSEFSKKSKGRRKYLACNDMKATARQIIIGYRLRWRIEIFHKEVKMFLGFEDVSAKWFDSVISHVHWVYCAYILLNSGPPGMPEQMKSLADKQALVQEMLKRKELSSLNQLMTQINGVQRLKNEIQQVLKGCSLKNHHIFQVLTT
jgi:Transposase DDE domain